jgi:protein-S-isoprenylcysteine O-methyltransferase Ste14
MTRVIGPLPYVKYFMQALEMKIPPPLVAALIAAGMWLLARVTPALEIPRSLRIGAAIVLAFAGIAMAMAGFIAFHRVKTTVSPIHPEETNALVTSGIFNRTRNPMYLGLLVVLLAWSVYLSAPWALAGLPAFVLYIDRFQIAPEERVLAAKFGSEFTAYAERVRRWL